MPVRMLRAIAATSLIGAAVLAACTSSPDNRPAGLLGTGVSSTGTAAPVATSSTASTVASRPPSSTVAPSARSSRPRPSSSTPSPKTSRKATSATQQPGTQRLPLSYPTGSADQVITVVARAQSDTQGILQTWQRSGSRWLRVGAAVHAWLGSDGMSPHPSEQRTAVPMGSYSLTQAFGHDSNPGTALPYVRTTSADWWISQAGPLYNTMQRCTSNCAFSQGDPNEHLFYEVPFYNYAVVIDYNRAPVRQGAGSAFFLHVTVGAPTQGCVSIVQSQLVRILRWLQPSQRPRILIGTA